MHTSRLACLDGQYAAPPPHVVFPPRRLQSLIDVHFSPDDVANALFVIQVDQIYPGALTTAFLDDIATSINAQDAEVKSHRVVWLSLLACALRTSRCVASAIIATTEVF